MQQNLFMRPTIQPTNPPTFNTISCHNIEWNIQFSVKWLSLYCALALSLCVWLQLPFYLSPSFPQTQSSIYLVRKIEAERIDKYNMENIFAPMRTHTYTCPVSSGNSYFISSFYLSIWLYMHKHVLLIRDPHSHVSTKIAQTLSRTHSFVLTHTHTVDEPIASIMCTYCMRKINYFVCLGSVRLSRSHIHLRWRCVSWKLWQPAAATAASGRSQEQIFRVNFICKRMPTVWMSTAH